jgi:hypothetical protein
MSVRYIDSQHVSDSQWIGWCTDEARGQVPKIRVSNIDGYPFYLTTPSGEPIKAYRSFKLASLAKVRVLQEMFE